MKWKLLLLLCLFGPLMGTLTVLGVIPEGTDRFAWFAVVSTCALLCARYARDKALLHGAVAGFWNGASATFLQGLFYEATVRNNPYMLEKFADQPEGFDLQFFIFRLVPFIGIAGGGMTGLLAMLAVWARSRRGR